MHAFTLRNGRPREESCSSVGTLPASTVLLMLTIVYRNNTTVALTTRPLKPCTPVTTYCNSLHRQVSDGMRHESEEGELASTNLPPELLLDIFEQLLPASYGADTFLHRLHCPSFTICPFHSPLLDAKSCCADLLSCLTVSRPWHAAAVTALYSRPILLSSHQLFVFCCTLEKNPGWGALVRHLFVLFKPQSLAEPHHEEQLTERARRTLKDALRTCKSLGSLTLTPVARDGIFTPVSNPISIDVSGIGQHLRSLTIFGTREAAQTALCSTVVLPSLEVLCIRGLAFEPGFTFPTLPKVHTLHLIQCSFHSSYADPDGAQLQITLEQIPELRVLHLYDNSLRLPLIFSSTLISNLVEIHDIDFNYGLHISRPWATQSIPFALRRLITTLSIQGAEKSLLSTPFWPPPCLEELTLIWPTPLLTANMDKRERLLAVLTDYVRSRSGASSLRKVTCLQQEEAGIPIIVSPNWRERDLATGAFKTFKVACKEHNIEHQEHLYSK